MGINHTAGENAKSNPENESGKQRADQFLKVKKASDKRVSDKRAEKNRKRYKGNATSGDTPADNLTSLIDYSKLSKVSAPVLNYILVDSGSQNLAVRFSGIMEYLRLSI